MCDYCDCRSHPQIAALSRDHDTLLGLLAELRRAVDGHDEAAARSVLGPLHDLLGPHAHREEVGVFTELRGEVGDGYVAAFEDDHERIHALLAAAGGPAWLDAAGALIDELAGHIAREETDLFPAAHQLLTPAQWDAVDESLGALTGGRP